MTLILAARAEPPASAAGLSEMAAPMLLLASILVLSVAAGPVKRFMDATAAQLGDVQTYAGTVLSAPGRR
jgi:hypothetical protein